MPKLEQFCGIIYCLELGGGRQLAINLTPEGTKMLVTAFDRFRLSLWNLLEDLINKKECDRRGSGSPEAALPFWNRVPNDN